jgi:DNA-binding SARP family transcriptional activator
MGGGMNSLEFMILGPLEARRLGEPVDLGGGKQRALLAALLLNANKVVAAERLVDELWGDEPPETAMNTLQVYVSQLRKILEPGVGARARVLQTRPPGYVAVVSEGQLDLPPFEALLVEGREALLADELEVAAERLRSALALWRGPCLAEVPLQASSQAAIVGLEELRLAAHEDLIVVELALGRQAAVVPELEALVAEHPYRESLRGHLMLALYRSGRQVDALEAFRQARQVLVDELGIEPNRELQRLEQAILQHEPALDAVPRAPKPPPEQLREPLVAAPDQAERRKHVAVAVIDIVVGADGGRELDPELVSRASGRAFEVVAASAARHHGLVYRAAGGRVITVFGAASAHEDDALRATRAVVDGGSALRTLAAELERDVGVRLGLQAGIEAGVALVGRDDAGDLSISGNVLFSAERAAVSAANDEIVIGGTARSLLVGAARIEPLAPADDERPLGRLLELVARPSTSAKPHGGRLVGRADELAELRHALARTIRERRCLLVTVLGEAGIGKSRLALELQRHEEGHARMVWGACRSYGEGVTLSPLTDIVTELVEDATIWAGAAARLGGDDEAEQVASVIAGAVGAGEPLGTTEEVFWAARRLLEVMARERPLVVVFDDVHWAEPTFLDLVEHVAEWSRDAAILLICLARPELIEERPSWGSGRVNAATLLLEPLSAAESNMLVAELPVGRELAPEARMRIASFGGGNPFFVEQLLAVAAQEPGFAAELSSPPTVQALLGARLDRLGPGERVVLEHASVVGVEFAVDALAELMPKHLRGSAPVELERLARRRLVRPLEGGVLRSDRHAFTHVLIREAAYDSLPKHRRAALHARLAGWFEEQIVDQPPELDEVVGYHLEQAHRYRHELGQVGADVPALAERAAARLAAAGRRADALGDMPKAVSLLGRASGLLDPDHPARAETLAELGEALRDAGDLERAETTLSEAIEAAARSGDAAAEARALAVRWQVRLQTDPLVSFEEVASAIGATMDRLLELGHERGLAKAWVSLAEVPWLRGQAAASEQALERGLAYARSCGDTRTEALALNSLVGVVFSGPTPVELAIRRCEQVLEQTPTGGRVAASALRALAGLYAMEGRFREAWEFVARDRAILRDLGLKVVTSSSSAVAGLVAMLEGEPARAEAELRWGYQVLDEMGDRNGLATVAAALAEAVLVQGRNAEALACTDLSRREGAPEDLTIQVQWRGPCAQALARRGQFDEADRLARQGVELAERTDFLDVHGNALMDLGEVLRLAGRPAEATAAARAALTLYERKGNLVSASRARAAAERMSLAAT